MFPCHDVMEHGGHLFIANPYIYLLGHKPGRGADIDVSSYVVNNVSELDSMACAHWDIVLSILAHVSRAQG